MNIAQLGVDYQEQAFDGIVPSPGGRKPLLFRRRIQNRDYYAYECPLEKLATPYFTCEKKARAVWT